MTKKKMFKVQLAGILSAVVVVGLLAVASVSAESGSLETYVDSLTAKVTNLLELLKQLNGNPKELTLGSSNNQAGQTNFLDSGLGFRNEDTTGASKDFGQHFFWTSMPAVSVNTTSAFMTNNTGRAVLVELSRFFQQPAGTVSSTVLTDCATSTKNGIAISALNAQLTNSFYNSFAMVTGTAGASENALGMPTTTKKLLYLANTESIVCNWRTPLNAGAVGSFETVSSSARGYTMNIYAPYIYAESQP